MLSQQLDKENLWRETAYRGQSNIIPTLQPSPINTRKYSFNMADDDDLAALNALEKEASEFNKVCVSVLLLGTVY